MVQSLESIDYITFEVGFEDTNSFRKHFKKATGISPGIYRQKFNRNVYAGYEYQNFIKEIPMSEIEIT